uniref:Uncharacterized protein n=1 Tax=Arundo donax TaxID=35708 RepID=A0A0A9DY75_ARUDO
MATRVLHYRPHKTLLVPKQHHLQNLLAAHSLFPTFSEEFVQIASQEWPHLLSYEFLDPMAGLLIR